MRQIAIMQHIARCAKRHNQPMQANRALNWSPDPWVFRQSVEGARQRVTKLESRLRAPFS